MNTRRQAPGFVVPHYLNLIIDVIIFITSIFLAYLLRFNFSIPASELKPLPGIIVLMAGTRLIIAILTKSYHGIIKYNSLFDNLKIYLFAMLGSIIFIFSSFVSYYFINKTLFIPLTIIIIEFLITTFLLLLSRSLIRVSHTSSIDKEILKRIKKSNNMNP